jgi:predicted ribosomally synthesized peptide with SipW-like signal peptide
MGNRDERDRKRKILLTLVALGLMSTLVGIGTFSAFSSTTSNDNNQFASGTVILSDNDAGAAMYSVSGKKPGDSVQACITLTYTGTLAADVKLYTTSAIGALGQYLDMTVDKGSGNPAFPGCTGFTLQSNIFTGTLQGFATAHNSYANGILAYPGAQTQWNQNDTLVYRFTLTLQNNNNAQGLSTGLHSFTWEAQNQ